jgi:glutamate synthase (NADPH/NADH) large chain
LSSCPRTRRNARAFKAIIADVVAAEGQVLIGFRDVPVDNSSLSKAPEIAATEPRHIQVFIGRGEGVEDQQSFERQLFVLRKVISNRVHHEAENGDKDFYFVSLSTQTIVYKGMFLAYQVGAYYKDLSDPRFESAVALVHQRFSTNTFPSWRLAHPYRMVAHNGEINTLRGNVNWMAARQASVSSPLFGDDISKLWPISYEGQSDTACFDNALEFLIRGGYSMAHAVMMLIPEAWAGNSLMSEERKAFYEYHAALMEPWDGPAAVAFTDGRQIGATLDRNGLRPARYIVTSDDRVIMASEAGVLPVDESTIVQVAAAARQDAADRHGRRPDHLRRGGQVAAGRQASLPGMAGAHPAHPGRSQAGRAKGACARMSRCSTASRRSAIRRKTPRS